MQIKQAMSRFITGYSSFSDVATKDIQNVEEERREIEVEVEDIMIMTNCYLRRTKSKMIEPRVDVP